MPPNTRMQRARYYWIASRSSFQKRFRLFVHEIIGRTIRYFSTHIALVENMRNAKRHRAGELSLDNNWAEKGIFEKTAGIPFSQAVKEIEGPHARPMKC